MVTKHEHIQFSLLNDDEHVHPSLRLCPLPSGLVVLLPTEHALLGPWRAEQCKLLVRNTDRSRLGIMALPTPIVVFLRLADDSVREVRSEAEGRSKERLVTKKKVSYPCNVDVALL